MRCTPLVELWWTASCLLACLPCYRFLGSALAVPFVGHLGTFRVRPVAHRRNTLQPGGTGTRNPATKQRVCTGASMWTAGRKCSPRGCTVANTVNTYGDPFPGCVPHVGSHRFEAFVCLQTGISLVLCSLSSLRRRGWNVFFFRLFISLSFCFSRFHQRELFDDEFADHDEN